MGTPTRNEIYEKAKQLYAQDCFRSGARDLADKTPEPSELLEGGFFHAAQSVLMSKGNPNVVVAESEKDVEKENRIATLDACFFVDVEELLRSGCFICGGKGTTKSNLAKIIADTLLKLGYVVKVFDISRAWLKSSLPFYVEVEHLGELSKVDLYQSVIHDLSQLVPNDVKRFVSRALGHDWNRQIAIPEHERKWIVYIFEEVQTLIPQGHLRSQEAQQLLRLLTTGRNYQFSILALTQRAALTDTSVFELCFQKYFARMDGENDLRKAAAYIGNKAYDLEGLKLGEFIYDMGRLTRKISTREFKPKALPTKLESVLCDFPQKTFPEPATQNTQYVLTKLAIALLWFAAIALGLMTMP